MNDARSMTLLDARTTAVVVVDVQNDFCHADGYYASAGKDITAFQAAVVGVRQVIERAREHTVPIVFTELIYDERGAMEDRHRIKPRKWSVTGRRLVPGSWGSATVDECRPQTGDIVIRKHAYSAFEGTDLESILNDRGVTTLLLCGVVTYACVLSTAFSAFDKGFDVCMVSDAVGASDQDLARSAGQITDLLLGRFLSADSFEFSTD